MMDRRERRSQEMQIVDAERKGDVYVNVKVNVKVNVDVNVNVNGVRLTPGHPSATRARQTEAVREFRV